MIARGIRKDGCFAVSDAGRFRVFHVFMSYFEKYCTYFKNPHALNTRVPSEREISDRKCPSQDWIRSSFGCVSIPLTVSYSGRCMENDSYFPVGNVRKSPRYPNLLIIGYPNMPQIPPRNRLIIMSPISDCIRSNHSRLNFNHFRHFPNYL